MDRCPDGGPHCACWNDGDRCHNCGGDYPIDDCDELEPDEGFSLMEKSFLFYSHVIGWMLFFAEIFK